MPFSYSNKNGIWFKGYLYCDPFVKTFFMSKSCKGFMLPSLMFHLSKGPQTPPVVGSHRLKERKKGTGYFFTSPIFTGLPRGLIVDSNPSFLLT